MGGAAGMISYGGDIELRTQDGKTLEKLRIRSSEL
jgi:hypothetical protein